MSMATRLDDRAAMGAPQNITLVETGGPVPVIDIPADESNEQDPPQTGTFSRDNFRAASQDEHRGHGEENLDRVAQQPNPQQGTLVDTLERSIQQQQQPKQARAIRLYDAADQTACDVDDFVDIETVAQDCGVLMKAVGDHVIGTMGLKRYGDLMRGRKGEVVAWIQAQRRPA
jgi:hypothetical protein